MLERFSEKQIEGLRMSVKEANLSVRATNWLRNGLFAIYGGDDCFIYQLVTLTNAQMLRIPLFGPRSLKEVNNWLVKYDLTSGMEFSEDEIAALEKLLPK
ncbi:MAG: DNA-directed RNA polymerase subunit alpha C-terminal domain-containing protein [Minisyncoccia bacterium]